MGASSPRVDGSFLEAVVEAVTDCVIGFEDDGAIVYLNRAAAAAIGDDRDAILGRPIDDLFTAATVGDLRHRLHREGTASVDASLRRADGEDLPVAVTVAEAERTDRPTYVATVRERDPERVGSERVVDRTGQERQLEALNDVARELMRADDPAAIGSIGVAAVGDVLSLENACIRLYDDDAKRFECVAVSDGAERLLASRPAYDLESTLAGHAFREERTVVNVQRSDAATSGPTVGNSSVHVPMGGHGVISVVLGDAETIDDRDVQLLEMLAVTVTTALARAERVQLLRAHDRDVQRQRDQLETLNRINGLVREIGRRLLAATTREELERVICDRLVDSELYGSAWIGDVEAGTDRVTTRVGANVSERDLEAIGEMSISSVGHGTVERTLESGAVEVARHYRLDGRSSGEPPDSVEDVRSTAAVPLTSGEQLLGVLVVNGTGEDVFGEEAVRGFASLGEVAGFAIDAIRNRMLLLSDSTTELEFEIDDERLFCLRVAAELGCECRLDRSVPLEEDRLLNYYTVSDGDPASVLAVAAEVDRVEDARIVDEGADGVRVQTLASRSLGHAALRGGATVRSLVADGDRARAVLELPGTADVRAFVEVLESSVASVDLVAKRERDRSIRTGDEFRRSVDRSLTEKQRSAIEAAYASGYYDWPRAITAEELAGAMDVSSSTLHQHLRKGVGSLLAAFFDESEE